MRFTSWETNNLEAKIHWIACWKIRKNPPQCIAEDIDEDNGTAKDKEGV